jgi:hypothetical protein
MIISHTILILQLRYSREATANRAPGQPLVFTAPGRFESAPVGYFNVEVAAAAGGNGGDSDGDMSIRSLVAPVVENVEAAAAAVGDGGVGIIFVPGSERRSDHRGMRSVTTTIGDRKRKATDGPV